MYPTLAVHHEPPRSVLPSAEIELELRLADFEADPGAGESWEIVREGIQRRLAQGG